MASSKAPIVNLAYRGRIIKASGDESKVVDLTMDFNMNTATTKDGIVFDITPGREHWKSTVGEHGWHLVEAWETDRIDPVAKRKRRVKRF